MKKYLITLFIFLFLGSIMIFINTYKTPTSIKDFCKCIKEECKDDFISVFINGSIVLVPKTNCECIEKICPPEMVE